MIGLVACSKEKLRVQAEAQYIYRSSLFLKARAYCKTHYPRWFILSAEYGLVHPKQVITPYETSMYHKTKEEKVEWGERVYKQIVVLDLHEQVFMAHAGAIYTSLLEDKLKIENPLAGLEIGEQYAWYDRNGQTILKRRKRGQEVSNSAKRNLHYYSG